MSHSIYHNGAPNMSHQQLTPLANLPTRPGQTDSPGSNNVLPPIQTQVNGYSYAPSFPRQDGYAQNAPPHIPSTQASMPLNRNASYPHTSQPPPPLPQSSLTGPPPHTYGHIPPAFSAPPPHHPMVSAAPGNPNMNGSVYGPISLPSIHQGGFEYRPPNAPMDFSNQAPPPRMLDAQGNVGTGQPAVVGSQGRRGILPSTMGRMSTNGTDGIPRANINPQKNPEGKYPCPYCPKTYLHLKHLKRHLLRHTGERPYQCYLCSETFCRSDILKRHFQKCSVRRGNPTNVTHLTHAQAHLRKNNDGTTPPESHSGTDVTGSSMENSIGRSWHSGPSSYVQYGGDPLPTRPMPDGRPHDSSRGSSIMRPSSRGYEDNKRLSGVAAYSSIHNSNNTSPSGSIIHEDRKQHTPVYPQRDQVPSQQPSHDTTSAPSFAGQTVKAEPAPQSSYLQARPNYAAYPGPHSQHMHAAEWENFFQPAANDPMFSSA